MIAEFSLSRFASLLASALLLAGCGSFPSEGPSASEIVRGEGKAETGDYVLIDATPNVVSTVLSFEAEPFAKRFTAPRPADTRRVGVGDTIAVSIYEAGEGGLFSTIESRQADIGPLVVEGGGTIFVPYAGEIRVEGRTVDQIREDILRRLQGRAIQPQAVVSIAENASSVVTVGGAVGSPGRVPLSLRGDRLLDVLSSAGGSQNAPHETRVTLTRGSRSGSVMLQQLVDDPGENVYLQPDDQLYLTYAPKTFFALGAVNNPGRHPFEENTISLIDAIGTSGSLADTRADSTGLFLFRMEDREVVEALGERAQGQAGETVPVIYRFNMRNPGSYFAAQKLRVEDDDILYVSNAPTTDLAKFLNMVRNGVGTVNTVDTF